MPVLKYREYVGAPWQVVGVISDNKEVKQLWNYCWEKRTVNNEIVVGEAVSDRIVMTTNVGMATVYYSSEIRINEQGEIELVSPESMYEYVNTIAGYGSRYLGKYFTSDSDLCSADVKGKVLYIPENATYGNNNNFYTTSCIVSTNENNLKKEFVFAETSDAYESEIAYNYEQTEHGANYDMYYALGSPIRNALAYYRLNPDAVKTVLEEMDEISVEEVAE